MHPCRVGLFWLPVGERWGGVIHVRARLLPPPGTHTSSAPVLATAHQAQGRGGGKTSETERAGGRSVDGCNLIIMRFLPLEQ
jgi:hypothetical protein